LNALKIDDISNVDFGGHGKEIATDTVAQAGDAKANK
jgi:hypothetical protein